jgi:Fe-S cluster assembly protein SufD
MSIDSVTKKTIDFRAKSSSEPGWLYDLRKAAWESYRNTPLPDRITHLWRYSDPGHFDIEDPQQINTLMSRRPDILTGKELQPAQGMAAYVANNSNMKSIFQTTAAFKESGAIIDELQNALKLHGDIIREHLGKLIEFDMGKFESMNLALWNNGILVIVPDNTVIEKPIYLYRHPTGKATVSRLLVVVGKNSEATIIDDYKCPCNKEATQFNSAVELFGADAARIRYVNLQRLDFDNRAYITQRTKLGRDSESYTLFASLGGGASKVNSGTILAGQGANSHIYGVAFGDGKQHFDHHTLHDHRASASFSNIDFKVVLKDKSNSAYTGRIVIDKDTVNCEAYQENRNLLMSKGCKAETIPELEILTDQVRCTHGATVGQVDPEQIFYLTSRGFSRDEAMRVIVSGFVEPTLAKMPNHLGDTIRDIIYAKLEGK